MNERKFYILLLVFTVSYIVLGAVESLERIADALEGKGCK